MLLMCCSETKKSCTSRFHTAHEEHNKERELSALLSCGHEADQCCLEWWQVGRRSRGRLGVEDIPNQLPPQTHCNLYKCILLQMTAWMANHVTSLVRSASVKESSESRTLRMWGDPLPWHWDFRRCRWGRTLDLLPPPRIVPYKLPSMPTPPLHKSNAGSIFWFSALFVLPEILWWT